MIKDKTDSIIFDLDGTLWDATYTVAKAWQAAINQVDYVSREITQEDIRQVAGTKHDLIFEQLFPELSTAQREELMALCGREKMERIEKYGGRLYQNLEATLAYLQRNYKLLIVSNCQDGYIEAFLKYHRLAPCFHDYECSGRTGKDKPDNLGKVIKRNNLEAPVFVGDTPGDQQAAAKNNIPFIYAGYGFQQVAHFDKKLTKVSDLKALF